MKFNISILVIGILFFLVKVTFAYDKIVNSLLQFDFKTISLNSKMTENLLSKKLVSEANRKLSDLYKENTSCNENIFFPKCVDLIKEFSEIISLNPNNRASLTLKFYLGTCLVLSHESFYKDMTNWEKIIEKALTIFNSISSEFPNTWEGKLSSTYNRNHFLAIIKNDVENQVFELRKLIPIYRELEKDAGFIEYLKIFNIKNPVEISVRDILIYKELELGHIEAAEQELKKVKGLKNVTEHVLSRLEREIERAKQKKSR
ncbi:hypothetical protein HYY75_03775 [bacterium]|nr:hypothetical protein [bacterium]